MCSLRFENNLLSSEGVRFKENTNIEAFVRFRFASVAITTWNRTHQRTAVKLNKQLRRLRQYFYYIFYWISFHDFN
jgi:hypothetical protein